MKKMENSDDHEKRVLNNHQAELHRDMKVIITKTQV